MYFAFNHMSSFSGTPFAPLMVSSILKYMPDSIIMQLSDRSMEPVPGVHQVIKGDFDYDKNTYPRIWLQLLSSVCNMLKMGDDGVVCCDADMVFGGDVSPLLSGEYDIAICKRPIGNGIGDNTSIQYRILHPYNVGFMIIKNPEILHFCIDIISLDRFHKTHWELGQHIIGLVVNSGEFRVKFLDSLIYNHTPKSVDDYNENVKVWHFKGDRKNWMVEWAERHYV